MAAPMSDVTGYRTDGGGLGQDQGLTKQLRNIITPKLPLLNAPGTVLENSLYYDINSSSVTAVEEQATFGKDKIMFNSTVMGASPSAYIPSVLFAGNAYASMVLNKDAFYGGVTEALGNNYFYGPHGWGFHMIENIIVYMGASSIAQIQISGFSNFLVCLAQCETVTKRNMMLTKAGELLSNYDKSSRMSKTRTATSKIFRLASETDAFSEATLMADDPYDELYTAIVPIRLPWTSMMALDKRLSFDTKLTTQPVQITLQTRKRDDVFNVGSNIVMSQQFDEFSLQLWQEELSDKSLSVRNELLAMPEFNVGYPFQYLQSIPFSTVDRTGSYDQEFLVNITSIINSDLTTFMFAIINQNRYTNTGAKAYFSPCYGEQLFDIELLLNGQRFFNFDHYYYEGVTLAKQMDTTAYEVRVPTYKTDCTSATPDVKSGSLLKNGYYYEFNNSRLRSIVMESHMQNTARFTNQTFQLKFKINKYKNNPSSAITDYKDNTYNIFMTYCYNAVYLAGGDGGTTKLITN